ncbi:hypothetical protein [uncultured Roseobacter sp.]|uniref:hypothetical protein n=1 Tax=uncultured Roseobacter sp. TaxID=114847 RepID=UPI00262B5115|nr:hypothetical protein [uncultured Roseobacter sp.]
MNYDQMRQYEQLQREELDTEYSLETVVRRLRHEGREISIRLTRSIWADFDLLVLSDVMTADEIVSMSQLGTEAYLERSFEANLGNFIQHAVNDLRRFL